MDQRIFGEIEGVDEGAAFSNRKALADADIHRPTVAGISGSAAEGSDSIVMSGGYEDDEDYGSLVIYTGHGGNEAGAQIADQEFDRGNKALAISCDRGLPVRVTRGANLKSDYAPAQGYRYDGVYFVENYWAERGKSGFRVYRYRLTKEQSPSDLSGNQSINLDGAGTKKPYRVATTTLRIVRDTAMSRKVKALYGYRCQVCGTVINTKSGNYAEAAHIVPLGRPHNGPDTADNVICLCPNHHAQFDKGGFAIADNLTLVGIDGRLDIHADHKVSAENLRQHRQLHDFE